MARVDSDPFKQGVKESTGGRSRGGSFGPSNGAPKKARSMPMPKRKMERKK